MNEAAPHTAECVRTLELLDRYMSNELDADDRAAADLHLTVCSTCSHELAERMRVRDALRRAVRADSAPAGLADAIWRDRNLGALNVGERSVDERSVGEPILGERSVSERSVGERTIDERSDAEAARVIAMNRITRRRMYAIAAMVFVALGAWLVINDNPARPQIAEGLPAPERQLETLLRVGVTDHVECVIHHGYGDERFEHDEIRDELDEDYAGLADVVRTAAPGYVITVGHHCSFGGREYVHLVLKSDGGGRGVDTSAISLAITLREPTDTIPPPTLAAVNRNGVPMYASHQEGHDVVGFESGRYLVYVIASQRQRPMHLATVLADPVSTFLRSVRA